MADARTPSDTVRSIRASIAKARACGWTDIEISLQWLQYKDLLALKRIDWEPTDTDWQSSHEDRPLKTFDGYPLRLGVAGAIVHGRETGHTGVKGWAVVDPYWLDTPSPARWKA